MDHTIENPYHLRRLPISEVVDTEHEQVWKSPTKLIVTVRFIIQYACFLFGGYSSNMFKMTVFQDGASVVHQKNGHEATSTGPELVRWMRMPGRDPLRRPETCGAAMGHGYGQWPMEPTSAKNSVNQSFSKVNPQLPTCFSQASCEIIWRYIKYFNLFSCPCGLCPFQDVA